MIFGVAEVLVWRRHAALFVLTTTRHFAAPHEAVCRKLSPMQPHNDSPHRFSLSLKEWRGRPVWFVLYGAADSFSNLPFRGILIAFLDGQLLYSDCSVLHSLAADPVAVQQYSLWYNPIKK